MKDEKKVNKVEEAKKEVQAEQNGVQLTDEELSSVAAGFDPFVHEVAQNPHKLVK